MLDLLENIGLVMKALFTEWIPDIAQADLGAIGTVAAGLGVVAALIGLYRKFWK